MDFLKRHYEKVILLGLFGFFIGLMSLVQSVINQTREVKPEDLMLPVRKPDYVNVDQDSADFNTDKMWEDNHLQWEQASDGKRSDLHSDMVQVYKMAVCPFCKEKSGRGAESSYTSVIPRAYFSNGKCPECQSELLNPWAVDVDAKVEEFRMKDAEKVRLEEERKRQEEERRRLEEEKRQQEEEKKRQEEEKKRQEEEAKRLEEEKRQQEYQRKLEIDRDGDSISNETEEQYGMDPGNPFDLLYDNDGDGFSNIYELEHGYMPNDFSDHPELWQRLVVADVKLRELNYKFMEINTNGSKNKRDWILQFNHPHENARIKRMTTSFKRLNQKFKVEGVEYLITDIEGDPEDVKPGADGKADVANVTVIVTEILPEGSKAKPRSLKFPLKKIAYSDNYLAVLEDTGNLRDNVPRRMSRRVGSKIKLIVRGGEKQQGQKDDKTLYQLLLKEVREYRVKDINNEKKEVTIEEILPENSKKKPRTFVVTTAGVIPKDKRVFIQKQSGNMADDLMKQTNAVVAKTEEVKKEETKKRDPNAPRKPLIALPNKDGLRYSEYDLEREKREKQERENNNPELGPGAMPR